MTSKHRLLVLLLLFAFSYSATASSQQRLDEKSAGNKRLKIMTVVIVQQDDFLPYLLAPYLAENDVTIEYKSGHHNLVAEAARARQADLVITHTKVKALHQLEANGILLQGKELFANPAIFLAPEGDPAHISGVTDPVEALKRIHSTGLCFVINPQDRIASIQRYLLTESNQTRTCIIDGSESFLDEALARNAYTMWSLHPYAKKRKNKLTAVLIPNDRLVENLSGWVVAGTGNEKQATDLLHHLASQTSRQRLTEFRLSKYPQLQAWWPPKKTSGKAVDPENH